MPSQATTPNRLDALPISCRVAGPSLNRTADFVEGYAQDDQRLIFHWQPDSISFTFRPSLPRLNNPAGLRSSPVTIILPAKSNHPPPVPITLHLWPTHFINAVRQVTHRHTIRLTRGRFYIGRTNLPCWATPVDCYNLSQWGHAVPRLDDDQPPTTGPQPANDEEPDLPTFLKEQAE